MDALELIALKTELIKMAYKVEQTLDTNNEELKEKRLRAFNTLEKAVELCNKVQTHEEYRQIKTEI